MRNCLLAEDLHAVAAAEVIIARNSEFVAAWREIDAANVSVDLQLPQLLARLYIPHAYAVVVVNCQLGAAA